jgi:hypothetical protein
MKPVEPRSERPKQNLMGCYAPITLLVVAVLCCASSKYLILTVPLNLPALIIPILVTGILPPIFFRIVYVSLYRSFKVRRLSAAQQLAVGLLRIIVLLCPPLLYRLLAELIRRLHDSGILSRRNFTKVFSAFAAIVLTLGLAWFIYLNFVMSV